MKIWVHSLALLNGLGIQRFPELWCRSQMQLGSSIAVAVAPAATAPVGPLAWEPPDAVGEALQRQKDKKQTNNRPLTIDLTTAPGSVRFLTH